MLPVTLPSCIAVVGICVGQSDGAKVNYPDGAVAQWLEQGTHNPSVVGSIPTSPTEKNSSAKVSVVGTAYHDDGSGSRPCACSGCVVGHGGGRLRCGDHDYAVDDR